MYTLYMILSEKTDKVYIGQTVNVTKRWATHLREANKGTGYAIHNAMRKYGIDTFDLVPLDTFVTRAEVDAAEIRWIAHYKALDRSYNITPGGEGWSSGELHPNYGKPWSEEQRAAQSKAMTGENNPMYGKTHTAETKAKLSQALTGKMVGEANPNYGKTGELNPMYGKTHTAETKARMSKAHTGKPKSEEHKANLSKAKTKYPPELIASYPNQKTAIEATGISRAHYNSIKKANPHLPWPVSARGRHHDK